MKCNNAEGKDISGLATPDPRILKCMLLCMVAMHFNNANIILVVCVYELHRNFH